MCILPREGKKRDAVQEESADRHRIVLRSAHRLEHHETVLDLHVHDDKSAAALAAAGDVVARAVVAALPWLHKCAAAATTTGERLACGAHCGSVRIVRAGRVQTARAARPPAPDAWSVRTRTPNRNEIRIVPSRTAAAAAEPSIVVAKQFADCITHITFTKRGQREAITTLTAIAIAYAIRTVGTGIDDRSRLAGVARAVAAARAGSDTAQTAATAAARSTIHCRSAKARGIDFATGRPGYIRTGGTAARAAAGCRAVALVVSVAEETAVVTAIALILLGFGKLERILESDIRSAAVSGSRRSNGIIAVERGTATAAIGDIYGDALFTGGIFDGVGDPNGVAATATAATGTAAATGAKHEQFLHDHVVLRHEGRIAAESTCRSVGEHIDEFSIVELLHVVAARRNKGSWILCLGACSLIHIVSAASNPRIRERPLRH